MVWCVFWFAPPIFLLTGLVILVRHGLCAARLLAEPPFTARWIASPSGFALHGTFQLLGPPLHTSA
jgi:hypothetical protein